MGSLSFEPSDKNIAFVEALLEGLNEYSKKLSATHNQEELTMNNNKYKEAKLHSASVYGDTVRKILNETHDVYCKPCKHYEKDKKVCDKTHHCDCDCPDCSPESYASESDFVE